MSKVDKHYCIVVPPSTTKVRDVVITHLHDSVFSPILKITPRLISMWPHQIAYVGICLTTHELLF